VSREVEARRARDPYFLTSKVVQLGMNLSEGSHLWLDRAGPWRAALRMVLAVAEEEVERSGATALVVRDLADGDAELDAFMLEQGLSRMPTMDTHVLAVDGDEQEWLASLGKKKRQQLRDVLATAEDFTCSIHGQGAAPLDDATVARLQGLYDQLAARKLRLNVFAFPPTLLPALLRSPAWEIGVLRIRPEAGGPAAPVAFWAAHVAGAHYAPLFCGLDDAWLARRGTYRAMLLQILRRARAIGAHTLHLGMDAEIEKRRFGAETRGTCIYAQVRDHYAGAQLREIVAEVALRADAAHAAK
jgi:hypothetical protein